MDKPRKKNNQEYNIKEDAQTECMVKLTGLDLQTYDLYEAIENNNINMATKAIESGANVNALSKPCSETKETPLEAAAYWTNFYDCSLDMLKLLKEAGAYLYDREKLSYIDKTSICSLLDVINKKKI